MSDPVSRWKYVHFRFTRGKLFKTNRNGKALLGSNVHALAGRIFPDLTSRDRICLEREENNRFATRPFSDTYSGANNLLSSILSLSSGKYINTAASGRRGLDWRETGFLESIFSFLRDRYHSSRCVYLIRAILYLLPFLTAQQRIFPSHLPHK